MEIIENGISDLVSDVPSPKNRQPPTSNLGFLSALSLLELGTDASVLNFYLIATNPLFGVIEHF